MPSIELERLLDPDPARGAEKYADLVERLTRFFEWRRCASPEDLAQETLLRGLTRIKDGADLYVDPVNYFFGIAQNVLKESRRADARAARNVVPDDELQGKSDEFVSVDARIDLARALALLPAADRALIVQYYTRDREQLRRTSRLTAEALRVRVHRILRRLKHELQFNKREKL
jgi:DNA-directed RNA polymerase specialized sigma24 family protein